jgi:iron complex transport system permease protein
LDIGNVAAVGIYRAERHLVSADASLLQPNNFSTRQVLPRISRLAGLGLGVVILVIAGVISLRIGTRSIPTREVWDAIFSFDDSSYNQTVVRSLRVPRTIIAIGVGGSLAVAGAVMQAVTRNPLADPSIMGVSSGASFAIVTAYYYGGLTESYQYVWFAFLGALVASVLVFLIGSVGRGGASPVKLALAGVVVTSLLGAWTSALLLLDKQTFEAVRFWFAGSVAGRDLGVFWTVSPFLLGGAVACLFLGHQLNVLSLGDETAQALGMRTARIRLICSIIVVLITGAAVSIAGPIGYVGLAIPHMVRAVVGPDYRWILPYSLVAGAVFLTLCDVVGRIAMRPGEIEVGIATAVIGAPFLVYLARKRSIAN